MTPTEKQIFTHAAQIAEARMRKARKLQAREAARRTGKLMRWFASILQSMLKPATGHSVRKG